MGSPESASSSELRPEGSVFTSTNWSLIVLARSENESAAKAALERLCHDYRRPLLSYLRRQRDLPEDPEDLVQGFFAAFLSSQSLNRVNRERGKFRSYLLAGLRNYVNNAWDRKGTEKRGGGKEHRAIEELQFELPDRDISDPDYDRDWALSVIDCALARLEHHYRREPQLFADLKQYLPGGSPRCSREELARERGITVDAIHKAYERFSRTFGGLLHEEVARTLSPQDDVREEIRYLMKILASSDRI